MHITSVQLPIKGSFSTVETCCCSATAKLRQQSNSNWQLIIFQRAVAADPADNQKVLPVCAVGCWLGQWAVGVASGVCWWLTEVLLRLHVDL